MQPFNVTLTVLDGPVTEGTNVVSYCIAQGGRPAATISWYKNGASPLQKSAVETTQLQVTDDSTENNLSQISILGLISINAFQLFADLESKWLNISSRNEGFDQ